MPRTDQAVDREEDGEIAGNHGGRERHVDQRPAEDQLDVEEPVAEDRDADRGGNDRERRDEHDRRGVPSLPSTPALDQARDERQRDEQSAVGQPQELEALDAGRPPEAQPDGPGRCEEGGERPDPERRQCRPHERGKRRQGARHLREGRDVVLWFESTATCSTEKQMTAAMATGRQRRVGRRPSGKTNASAIMIAKSAGQPGRAPQEHPAGTGQRPVVRDQAVVRVRGREESEARR